MLKQFFDKVPTGFRRPGELLKAAKGLLYDFIHKQKGWEILEQLRANVSDPEHFTRAVHAWFDSLQLIRFARQYKQKVQKEWIFKAWLQVLEQLDWLDLLDGLGMPEPEDSSLDIQIEWLHRVRGIQNCKKILAI